MHLLEVDLVVEIQVNLVERSVEEAFEEHAAAHGDIDEKADGENGGHASGDEDDVGLVDVAFVQELRLGARFRAAARARRDRARERRAHERE